MLDAPLSYKQTRDVAADLFASGAFNAVMIQSMPGTGKNSLAPTLKEMLQLKHMFICKPGHHENYDFHGLAVPVDALQKTIFYPSGTLLPDPNLDGGCFAVWDEFSDSPTNIQNLLCQFVLENRCHGYEFPYRTMHLLLGNSITHRSGANRIITKLANRAGVIHMMPTVQELFDYGAKMGWPSSILAFLKMRGADPINPNDRSKTEQSEFFPTFFNSFDPNDPAQSLKPVFASSRSWEATARLITFIDEHRRSMEDYELLPRVAALIGMPVASAFVPFRSEVMIGPDPDDIAAGKRVAYPKKASILWNLTIGLVTRATKTNVKTIYNWLDGCGNREFSILFVQQCFVNRGKYLIGDEFKELLALPDVRQAMAYND